MAEFEVVLSSMTDTAGKVRQYCEDFRTAANELKDATAELTSSAEGWNGEASQIFNENIVQANTWMTEMSALVDEFAAALDKARETYQTADETSAKQFSK